MLDLLALITSFFTTLSKFPSFVSLCCYISSDLSSTSLIISSAVNGLMPRPSINFFISFFFFIYRSFIWSLSKYSVLQFIFSCSLKTFSHSLFLLTEWAYLFCNLCMLILSQYLVSFYAWLSLTLCWFLHRKNNLWHFSRYRMKVHACLPRRLVFVPAWYVGPYQVHGLKFQGLSLCLPGL